MSMAKGPRPWSIRAFAVLLLLPGLWHFAAELLELYRWTSRLVTISTENRAEIDWTIITACARLTIVCIPVAAVYLFASKSAKWLITATASYICLTKAISLISTASGFRSTDAFLQFLGYNWAEYITAISLALASLVLFTRPSARWFQQQKSNDVDTFA